MDASELYDPEFRKLIIPLRKSKFASPDLFSVCKILPSDI